MTVKLPEKFEAIIENSTQEWYDTRGTTREELRKFIEGRVLRDLENAPKVGEDAPDFNIERLDDNGNRTGEMERLSDHFGTPIGLIFGSYT